MNRDDKENVFLQHSKKLLDDSVDALDAATLSRLNQARQRALGAGQSKIRRSGLFSDNRFRTVFASFAVAAIVALLWTATPQQKPAELAQQYEDIDMLTADADFELLEDLEFVSWLLEENLELPAEINDAG